MTPLRSLAFPTSETIPEGRPGRKVAPKIARTRAVKSNGCCGQCWWWFFAFGTPVVGMLQERIVLARAVRAQRHLRAAQRSRERSRAECTRAKWRARNRPVFGSNV